MTQMRTAGLTHYLGTPHAERRVVFLLYRFIVGSLIEARPTTARVILVLRIKQGLVTANTNILTITFVVIVFARKGALGTDA